MLNPLLPERFDNAYRGHSAALWLLGRVLFVRMAMSVNSIFNGYLVASSADGIPLDTYTAGGARAVVSLFALLGLWQLIVCLLGVLVLIRSRTMVPLVFVLFLLQYLGGRLILRVLPIPRSGSPPGPWINLALLAVMIVGFALSFWRPRSSSIQE